MVLGRELAAWRARRAMSREAAASAAGVSAQAVGAWERGEAMPRAAHLGRLLAAYDVPREQWPEFLEMAGAEP